MEEEKEKKFKTEEKSNHIKRKVDAPQGRAMDDDDDDEKGSHDDHDDDSDKKADWQY